LAEQARRHVAVTAIVARSRKNQHATAPDLPSNGTGNRVSRCLHQIGTGVAVACGGTVGLTHLIRRQQR
jgi:hypothetical protein